MAGTDPRFSASRFIEAITFAQNMGLPESHLGDLDLEFFFEDTRTWPTHDSNGAPWDFRNTGAPVGAAPPASKKAICGVSKLDTSSGGDNTRADTSAVGRFRPWRLLLTFLPEPWAEVSGFTSVRFSDVFYDRTITLEPQSLFEVRVERVEVRARDL